MSHFTKVKSANIVSKTSFISACKEMGYKDISENSTIRGWAGRTTDVDVAVKVPNSKYDFGIKKTADGKKFDLIAENYFDQKTLGKVAQLTAKHEIVSAYRKQGFAAQVSVGKNNALVVTLTR